jgi:GNAT superfamily N-acetyltransferase
VRTLREKERAFVGERLPLSRLGKTTGEYLVAWDGARPVGHAHIEWGVDPPELQDVFVVVDCRRQGIASALTAAAEARAAGRGHRRLSLTVSVENASAQALYRKLGYVRTAAPPRRVKGTVQLRTGPLEVDDTLVSFEKPLY